MITRLFDRESRVRLVADLTFEQIIVMNLRVRLQLQTKGKSVRLTRVVQSLAKERQARV
jgi:hypothetical protein